jgi:4-amino-4-deoxy-L-arabinose transferase-like glycosyltransferase|tara:strand:+ start:291 stop:1664 length:1374 start_codon:yes stop_codon:yes gene_type:complete
MIAKKNITKVFFLFLFFHLFLWTLVPSISNINLPLDTIEALAWGSNLDWGFSKHPPFSAFAVEVFYQLFGNQDWSYYLLSQIFIVTTFFIVFKLANEFFKNINLAFLSVLLLEGIYFYNYTTPEFNVNISQLPFWALSIYFTWRCLKSDKALNYVFLGLAIGLGVMSKYLFLYLVIGIKFLFIYLIFKKKKIKIQNFFLAGSIALIVILPHLIWLVENNFITIIYGLQRSEGIGALTDHIFYPIIFILKQIIILTPFFLMLFFLIKKIRLQNIVKDEKIIFLFFTCITPIILMILTSVIMGAKLRTMWMTPFYLFFGILFLEIFKRNINLKKLKKFYVIFIFFFLLSPIIYLSVSLTDESKRTDYPGKEIARLVQNKWDDNFINEIKIVIGDEWSAGNLSYHLNSRPTWIIDLKNKTSEITNEKGVIYVGNPKILKKICPGVYGTIKPVGYCMIGKR